MTVSIILSSILLGASFVLFFYTAEKFTLGTTKKVALSVYALVAIGCLVNIFLKAFGI
ncbi:MULTISPECIES: hypothetical protein [Priestia]|uniref:hypothetical protein n=1 Tax=Priestia TaxID=2800373 RepID=UPI0016498DC3|nr:hypothetical protein [Priestia megaterium]